MVWPVNPPGMPWWRTPGSGLDPQAAPRKNLHMILFHPFSSLFPPFSSSFLLFSNSLFMFFKFKDVHQQSVSFSPKGMLWHLIFFPLLSLVFPRNLRVASPPGVPRRWHSPGRWGGLRGKWQGQVQGVGYQGVSSGEVPRLGITEVAMAEQWAHKRRVIFRICSIFWGMQFWPVAIRGFLGLVWRECKEVLFCITNIITEREREGERERGREGGRDRDRHREAKSDRLEYNYIGVPHGSAEISWRSQVWRSQQPRGGYGVQWANPNWIL